MTELTVKQAATTSCRVERSELVARAARLLDDGWRLALVAAHEEGPDAADGFRVVHAFVAPVGRRTELTVEIPRDDAWVPTLAGVSFAGGRFEREVRDLYGIRPEGHPLPHRLIRHGHWPTGWYPMLAGADPCPHFEPDVGSYPFLEVQGQGVYEIPVGPVHAGLIEPGHFRFSVVGETVLRMKARLWFVHRGVEKLFEGRPPQAGIELAERVSGDTAVGHCLAYATAVEEALGIDVPQPARLVRALLLELERIHNHVSDLGAMANDVGFGIAHAHTQRLRESLLRHHRGLTGHRLLRGGISVGGAGLRRPVDLDLLARVAREAAEVARLTLDHPVVADRFTGTAVLAADDARHLGALGFVARASGVDVDARRDHPFVDLSGADGGSGGGSGGGFGPVVEAAGDVLARFVVRRRELAASVELVTELAARLGSALGGSASAATRGKGGSSGFGVVEAWRGALCHRVELTPAGALARVKIVDPSFFNWPALPVALADTIVPDFPLANKSFNQSYAGNDL